MKKYLPIVFTALAAIAPLVSPAVQAFYASHATVVADLLAVWGVVKYFLPSPIAQSK